MNHAGEMEGNIARALLELVRSDSSDSTSDDSDDEILIRILEVVEERKTIIKVQNYMELVSVMHADTFKTHFRINRTSFEAIRRAIVPLYGERNTEGGHPSISIDKALLLTIWALANQESFRGISDRFNISNSNAHRHFRKICEALCNLTATFLHWPNENEMIQVRADFARLRGVNSFPNVIGAVDGMHIPIPAPKVDPASFYNRKGFHSILLQGICDSKSCFMDVFVGWPGSSHDARVWRGSPIARALAEDDGIIPEGTHILGDSAYPLLQYLMTPFRDNGHLSPRQRRYNGKLSTKRVVIEQAFGLLKCRFRRLKFLNMVLMDEMKTVVIACCVLHNICIKQNDMIDIAEDIQADDENGVGGIEIPQEGAADKRNSIADLLYRQ